MLVFHQSTLHATKPYCGHGVGLSTKAPSTVRSAKIHHLGSPLAAQLFCSPRWVLSSPMDHVIATPHQGRRVVIAEDAPSLHVSWHTKNTRGPYQTHLISQQSLTKIGTKQYPRIRIWSLNSYMVDGLLFTRSCFLTSMNSNRLQTHNQGHIYSFKALNVDSVVVHSRDHMVQWLHPVISTILSYSRKGKSKQTKNLHKYKHGK